MVRKALTMPASQNTEVDDQGKQLVDQNLYVSNLYELRQRGAYYPSGNATDMAGANAINSNTQPASPVFHVYLDGGRVASFVGKWDEREFYPYFFNNDHLGDTSLMLDGDGHIVQHNLNSPYRESLERLKADEASDSMVHQVGGHSIDLESGCYWQGAMYYCPEFGLCNRCWKLVDITVMRHIFPSPPT